MVCRGINSICPIHAFLLSRSVQATGGGSCWAALPGLISKGYKLHYPAQSEPARTAPSIHPLFLFPPLLFSRCCFLWWPPSLFPSSIPLSISFWVGDWWGLSSEPFQYLSIEPRIRANKHKQTHTGPCTVRDANTHKHVRTARPGPGRSNRGSLTGLMGKQATVYGWDSNNLSLKPEPGPVFV